MSKDVGISTAENPNGTWRWKLHVKKEKQQEWMKGIEKN